MATRREYSAEFKREAVQLAQQRGNISAAARELGIHLSMLRRWKNELLWQAFKYRWLPFSAYESVQALRTFLHEILVGIGTKFRITFE